MVLPSTTKGGASRGTIRGSLPRIGMATRKLSLTVAHFPAFVSAQISQRESLFEQTLWYMTVSAFTYEIINFLQLSEGRHNSRFRYMFVQARNQLSGTIWSTKNAKYPHSKRECRGIGASKNKFYGLHRLVLIGELLHAVKKNRIFRTLAHPLVNLQSLQTLLISC